MESIKLILNKIKNGNIKEMLDELYWVFSYAKNYKKEIIFYTFLGIFSTIMSLVSAIASKELINIVTGIQTNRIVEMSIIMVSMALFSLLFNQWMSRITLKINIRIQNDIQADIFDKIIHVNWLELTKYHSGDLLNRFSSDVVAVARSAIGWLPNLIIKSFSFIATLLLIMYYDPTMMILALFNAPVMLIASKILMKRMRSHHKLVKEMNSEMTAFQSETFSNVDAIKSFGLIDLFNTRLKEYQEKYKNVNLDYNAFTIKSNLILSIIGFIIHFSYFGWAVYRLWSGVINYGELTLFLQQFSRITNTFNSLINIIPETISSTISARRLMEIIELPKEESNEDIIIHLNDIANNGFSVELEDVCFSYVNHQKVLTTTSMLVNPGEIIALVGPSGEGKTTLIRMFLGLITPMSGTAVLKDFKGDTYELNASTRHLFSYVPQGNTIFSGTIADNLRMVKEDADDKEIIQALKSVCAWDFVEKMEEGIYSKVGARGKGLSEGQAQRIAIARAILRDAPILLLDEATSSLDVDTERKVLKNIIVNHPNKCCIITTHRPSVLNVCHKVYRVLDTKLTQISKEEF